MTAGPWRSFPLFWRRPIDPLRGGPIKAWRPVVHKLLDANEFDMFAISQITSVKADTDGRAVGVLTRVLLLSAVNVAVKTNQPGFNL